MKFILLFSGLLTMSFQLAFAQTKTGHVRMEVLADTLPSRKQAMKEIQLVTLKAEEELAGLEKQLVAAYNNYLEVKSSQSSELNQFDETKIQQMQSDAQKREQEIRDLLQRMTNSMNDNSIKLIKEAMALVAKSKGYTYVIDESSTLFASGTDLTNMVIAELLRLDALGTTQK